MHAANNGPEYLKMCRQKKIEKSKKSIHEILFWIYSIFFNFKNSQKAIFYWRPKYFQLAPKNSWNQINQFHEKNIFWPNSIFCNFKNSQKAIFWTGKKFKTSKNAVSRNKSWGLFDCTSFFAWTCFKFSGPLLFLMHYL